MLFIYCNEEEWNDVTLTAIVQDNSHLGDAFVIVHSIAFAAFLSPFDNQRFLTNFEHLEIMAKNVR